MSTLEVDQKLAVEECSPLNEEEMPYLDACKQVLTPEQAERMSMVDYITIIRGYQTYEPRLEETQKACKMIADWRDKVGYYNYLSERLEGDEKFFHMWEETIYGRDDYGHPIVCVHISDVDVDGLDAIPVDHLLRLQGQKQTAYLQLKHEISEEIGQQRYKYILIVDMKGVGLSIVGGKKRNILQKIFSVGADNFPESIWKIFVINTPFMFRGIWAMIKPWIHPITQAKVNIHGSISDAVKAMEKCGIPTAQLPQFMGGASQGTKAFDYLLQKIEENQTAAAQAPTPAAEAAPAQADAVEAAAAVEAETETQTTVSVEASLSEDVGRLAVV
eukprot:m.287009 g.287009  ORF g.287009 m.287009 type:complete len:331 (-) comp15786_c2_seq1:1396-2388(-)